MSGEGGAGASGWPEDRARRWGVRALYAVLGAAAIYVLVRNMDGSGDYRNFLPFGHAALAGQIPYLEAVEEAWLPGVSEWATWPPSFAPLAALLARLDATAGTAATVALWQAANLAGLGLVLATFVRWLHGRRLSLRPGPGRMPLYALPALVGILVPARVLLGNFEHSQSNLLFLGLAVAAFALFRRGRRWGGGAALGLATAFKGTPLLALPYLAWRGRWRDLAAALGGCLLTWGLLPALTVGPAGLVRWYREWWRHTAELHLPTAPMNQSLQATLTRLAAPGGTEVAPPQGRLLGGYGAEPWTLAALAALALGTALAFGRPFREVPARREALELGVVLTLMGLVSPFAWKFHFVGMSALALALYAALPAAAARAASAAPGARPDSPTAEDRPASPSPERTAGAGEAPDLPGGVPILRDGPARAVAAVLVAVALAVNLSATGIVGGGPADALERWGVVTWPAAALVVAGLAVLARGRRG